jgi:hypothetical protein
MKTLDDDEDWKAAEKALEAACRLPGGSERIEALKHAGRLRFYADRKRLAKENMQRGSSEQNNRQYGANNKKAPDDAGALRSSGRGKDQYLATTGPPPKR